MPYIETPDDLADHLADRVGVYGGHEDGEAQECRVCFVSEYADRMRAAVRNEKEIAMARTQNAPGSWMPNIPRYESTPAPQRDWGKTLLRYLFLAALILGLLSIAAMEVVSRVG